VTAATLEELAAIPLLRSLSQEELRAAAEGFAIRSYQKDAIVATEGDRVEWFNFILSGNVQAFWRDEEGHQLKLGVDGPGMHFPDVTLGGEPALVSHIALTDLRLASIRTADLMQLMQRHPVIGNVLLMDVVARLRRMVARTKTLTMEDVYGRVVKLLLSSAVPADGALACERLTHAEIGQRIGATREMVGRVLRDLARGGYIETDGARIVILRPPPGRW
jgi:CRP/FNR family cyclic AMP-dependent transcriptional regulator